MRVKACGICGSDVHGYDGSSGRRIPPLVMGHEAAGIVERTGRAVTNVRPGDPVTFDSTISCGTCAYCRRGAVNLCDRRTVLGVSCAAYRRDGAFADYVAVPERVVYRLPDSVLFEQAALVEPLAVAAHAVAQRPPQPHDTVLVIGCGIIGLLIIQVLRARGCADVIAVDVDDSRLKLAARSGAKDAVNFSADDSAEKLSVPTFDAAFEAVGRHETVAAAIRCVRKGGTVALVGNVTPAVSLPLQDVVTREIALLGSCASGGEYPQCIDWIASGVVDAAPLLSAAVPLEDGPAWFDRLYRREPGLLKIVLRP